MNIEEFIDFIRKNNLDDNNVVLLSDGGCQCSYMGKDTMVYKAKSANLSIIF